MSVAQNCMVCKQPICTCEDFEERLDECTNVAYKACKNCLKHYDRCKCEAPEYAVRVNGDFDESITRSARVVCRCNDEDYKYPCSVHTREEPH